MPRSPIFLTASPAGYRSDPPKVWIYQECSDKKETLVDVQMK